jgi:DNA-binding NtrC family response regulator
MAYCLAAAGKRLETIECESAEAARAIMLLRGPKVCLVFADLRLSGLMDGVDLARELKMRWPHLIVVVTSGNPGTRLVHLPPGVVYMPKPWHASNLLTEVERALSVRSIQGHYEDRPQQAGGAQQCRKWPHDDIGGNSGEVLAEPSL